MSKEESRLAYLKRVNRREPHPSTAVADAPNVSTVTLAPTAPPPHAPPVSLTGIRTYWSGNRGYNSRLNHTPSPSSPLRSGALRTQSAVADNGEGLVINPLPIPPLPTTTTSSTTAAVVSGGGADPTPVTGRADSV